MLRSVLCILALIVTSHAAAAMDVRGQAFVINGAIIKVGNTLVRLRDIDPPVSNQRCDLGNGTEWYCGRSAAAVLRLMAHTRPVSCNLSGEKDQAQFAELANCEAAGQDIGEEMLRRGMAWAAQGAPQAYQDAEREARERKIGVFQAATATASQFRVQRQRDARTKLAKDCVIKGNVDLFGRRIYHTPWSQWYALTKVTESKGDRWFCSEKEAVSAGWQLAEWDFVPRLDADDMPAGGVLENQR
ncbi:MAG: thermonuclease family protein [Pseudomonadota bacterium]